MAVCKANMLFVILTCYTVMLNRCANTNELLMQTFSKVLLLDTRMDNIEIKLENSLTDLQTQLAEGLERIAETQKNYEPKLGGITNNIQSTISNTVAKMVKTQFIAISTSMKREKVALRNLKTEMNKHMKAIDGEFQNIQKTIEARFLNQSIAIEEHNRAQKENVSDVMNKVIIETNARANQLTIDFENAQSSFVERFTNQTKALEEKFERQSDDIGELSSDVRNEMEQLEGNFGDVQKSLNKAIDDIKEETNNITFNIKKTLIDNLETMQSKVNLRFTNQEDIITSLNSTIGSTEGHLQSYKSSCDVIRSDVSNIENRVSSVEKVLSVDGQWGNWTGWTKCDTRCETGHGYRTRECNNPAPRYGGARCSGYGTEIRAFADCSKIRQNLGRVSSGVYHITTWKTNQNTSVFCDMDTDQGGWTVFQHRVDGSVDFYRNFSSYENGFGSLQGEFWLGLKMMHEMTSRTTHDLRIDITRANDSTAFVVYAGFSVGAGSNYTLQVGDLRSEKGLSVPPYGYQFNIYANGSAFSTFDHDNDVRSWGNCAVDFYGAWWYKSCSYKANLNGRYYTPGTIKWDGMNFHNSESLKTSRMMFRPAV